MYVHACGGLVLMLLSFSIELHLNRQIPSLSPELTNVAGLAGQQAPVAGLHLPPQYYITDTHSCTWLFKFLQFIHSVRESEDKLWESVLSFNQVGSKDQTPVV